MPAAEREPANSVDAFLPPEMATRAENIGAKKVRMPSDTMFVLAVLAGAFVALGAAFSTTVVAGADNQLPYGVTRLLAGFCFCLGLILVVVAGAELFTGNNLKVMALASGRISMLELLRAWTVVYVGNLVGSVATAWLMILTRQHEFSAAITGITAINIAMTKCQLDFLQAFALGVLCNALVCLAVWLCYSGRSTTDKILAIVFPVTAFVACSFEHSVANMYFVPYGIFLKSTVSVESLPSSLSSSPAFADLTWDTFVFRNLFPVTLGNIVGGSFLVGIVYWYVYLRPHQKRESDEVS